MVVGNKCDSRVFFVSRRRDPRLEGRAEVQGLLPCHPCPVEEEEERASERQRERERERERERSASKTSEP